MDLRAKLPESHPPLTTSEPVVVTMANCDFPQIPFYGPKYGSLQEKDNHRNTWANQQPQVFKLSTDTPEFVEKSSLNRGATAESSDTTCKTPLECNIL
jgi:hypothetical protein